jgi:hypothetical protein
MIYQVGRVCAVAGYKDLYRELDVQPEVHIAEEAREAGNIAIYEDIMSKSMRYAVMNENTRTIAAVPKPGACLNGDTAVYRSLEKRSRRFDMPMTLSSRMMKMNLSTLSSPEDTTSTRRTSLKTRISTFTRLKSQLPLYLHLSLIFCLHLFLSTLQQSIKTF